MDKGHQTQFNKFTERIKDGAELLISLDEIINVTLASFAAMTSSREGKTIFLDEEYPLK